VRLTVENPFPEAKVNADSERLMQVLTNLLSNAVKYSPQEDTVRVSVSQQNSAVRVSVTDHGAGVPEGFGDRIFHEFAQVDSTDRRGRGGTGLGLYISKKIIEDHGGHIGYDSEPGVATTFYFDLPGLPEPGPSEEEGHDGPSEPRIDDLTGLMDRPRFEEELDREWKRTARSGLPLSLILVEVDYFELYNSTYGKLSGQECLRMLARALREAAMRSSDLLARYGNAQYAALLPETDAAGAAHVADKIRARAEALAIEFARPRARGIVTVSTGIATVRPNRDSSPSAILTAAEQALSEAKENG
jgi:diguanylate cyclase (GGDEF)-like protein